MKKIMFNDLYGLHDAVMRKHKTQTRRIIPKSVLEKADAYRVEYYNGTFDNITLKEAAEQLYFAEKRLKLPYNIGETVAIAQRYSDIVNESAELNDILLDSNGKPENSYLKGWNNKMFIQSHLMPHHIRITDVHIEQLQDISNEDVLKEGFYYNSVNDGFGTAASHWEYGIVYYDKLGRSKVISSRYAKEAYSFLIDKISGIGTWESNPMVIVYDFELVD